MMEELGRGRSGVVYRDVDPLGRTVARKVFSAGDTLTRLTQIVFLGSSNPYRWNEDAVRCAVLRRRILGALLEACFGSRLTVSEAHGHRWNPAHRAWEMITAYVPGRHAALRHPLNPGAERELEELDAEILPRLRQILEEAGFDGLQWQAGFGNPVATSNFLLLDDDPSDRRWVWIDLESGVPALFPWSPRALFGFYLPRAWRLGRPLFDDVDPARLDAFVGRNADILEAGLGAEGVAELRVDIAGLAHHQQRWKSLGRIEASIGDRLARGDVTAAEAAYYVDRPVRWIASEARRGVRGIGRALASLPARTRAFIEWLDVRALPRAVARFLTSQRYREQLSRDLIKARIDAWIARRQIAEMDAKVLRDHLESEEASSYLTDFGIHVAIKPFVKVVQWTSLPSLLALGILEPVSVGLLWAMGGAIGRTVYTSGRLLQSAVARRERPWVALGTGLLPAVGNFAYAFQILYSSVGERAHVARFIVQDGGALIGQALPIWGGQDTAVEHWGNRLPDRVLRGLARRGQSSR